MSRRTREEMEQAFERLRGTARGAIVTGALICGFSAIRVSPPPGTPPLALGPLRPALELWSRFFFGVGGPALLVYGLAVATGLLYLSRGARRPVAAAKLEPLEAHEDLEERRAA